MNKEQAKKEYEKIIHESNEKVVTVIEEAKKNGIWKPGLDTNEKMFAEINEETRKKVKSLLD